MLSSVRVENLLVSMRRIDYSINRIVIKIAAHVRSLQHLNRQILIHLPHNLHCVSWSEVAVMAQQQAHCALGVNRRIGAPQLRYLPRDAHRLAGERIEVLRGDSRC